jgi:probable F420-dependent oxidoreductase
MMVLRKDEAMKFGLRYCNSGPYLDAGLAMELVQAGEEAGFESAWTVDHVVVPAGYESLYPYAEGGRMAGGRDETPWPDPLIWMSFAAAATKKIKLATGILIVPQRNPIVTAKQIATLDRMSGGRVLLGIGVGWMKEEFEVIGADFPRRGPNTDEFIAAMQALWSQSPASFEGEVVKFNDVYCEPQPANDRVPIIVGGHSKAAAKRAGRLGDGFFPARDAPAELIALAKQTATENGRDPSALEITASLPEDLGQIPALAAAGVDRLLVPVSPIAGLQTVIESPEDALTWRERIAEYAD